jgi:hypothetical protein
MVYQTLLPLVQYFLIPYSQYYVPVFSLIYMVYFCCVRYITAGWSASKFVMAELVKLILLVIFGQQDANNKNVAK